jgi:erythromycin esterase-like protein
LKNINFILILIIFIFLPHDCFARNNSLPEGIYSFEENISNRYSPIIDIFNNVDILAVGEIEHTSKGFYQIKVELIKYLVKNHGLRCIGIEDNWISVRSLDEYLQKGGNSSIEALHFFDHHIWRSESILNLIEYLRQYNICNPNDMVSIFGFDIQNIIAIKKLVIEKLQNNELALSVNQQNKLLSCLKNETDNLDNECNLLLENIVSSSHDDHTRLQLISLLNTINYIRTFRVDFYKSQEIRDRAMADIIKVESKGVKTFIWSSDGHVVKFVNNGNKQQISMGSHLDKYLGKKYAAILLTASKFDVDPIWSRLHPGNSMALEGSIEEWLETFEYKALFINFDKVNSGLFEMSTDEYNSIGPVRSANGLIWLNESLGSDLIFP